MATVPSISVLAVGRKGFGFVEDLTPRFAVRQIVTYAHAAAGEPSVREFADLARRVGAEFVVDRRPGAETLVGSELAFTVGWQYLLGDLGLDTVVLHDSLLPRHRGFAPTVAALIAGDGRIGVTALLPVEEADAGPILAQSGVDIVHPIRIGAAFEAIRPCFLSAAIEVIDAWMGGPLVGTMQERSAVTHSIWRDEQDQIIDWSWASDRIVRFVHALGAPYGGARTMAGDEIIVVGEASEIDDVRFSERHPGKVWRIGPAGVDIVCGHGMVRVAALTSPVGEAVEIHRLRTRLGHGAPIIEPSPPCP